jgi:hypothetical protein
MVFMIDFRAIDTDIAHVPTVLQNDGVAIRNPFYAVPCLSPPQGGRGAQDQHDRDDLYVSFP